VDDMPADDGELRREEPAGFCEEFYRHEELPHVVVEGACPSQAQNMTQVVYTRTLLELYCGLPHTAVRRPTPQDRRIADELFDRGVPFYLVEMAFLLALGRRSARPLELRHCRLSAPSPTFSRCSRS